ncbi:MAG: hypothetical protein ACRDHY_01650, partial [Anaerolineales bacterium]
MTPAILLLAALGAAAQAPSESAADRMRALAESGAPALLQAVRERPHEARLVVRLLLEQGAFGAAERVAGAYAV